jgi:23S rRNA pseudouridine2604 synthase
MYRKNSRPRLNKRSPPAPTKATKPKRPSPIPSEDLYPMRINKYLAWKKVTTRKGGDELVQKKLVFINGKLAQLGDRINEGDDIEVRKQGLTKKFTYYAFNKPIGVVTHADKKGEKDIKHLIDSKLRSEGVFPIGRLDKDSSGLIILTNDGRITDQLLNPEYIHDKEYLVSTKSKLRSNFKQKMEGGVNIEGYVTRKCKIQVLGDFNFRITLSEGKKHQIRRMCSALFNDVNTLQRIRIMNVQLGDLHAGKARKIEGVELEDFMKALGF